MGRPCAVCAVGGAAADETLADACRAAFGRSMRVYAVAGLDTPMLAGLCVRLSICRRARACARHAALCAGP
ncbi:MAG: hypothetical protein ACLRRT_05840 [Ruthenibacterium lactatiformans]